MVGTSETIMVLMVEGRVSEIQSMMKIEITITVCVA
jgi:hypothetical protein